MQDLIHQLYRFILSFRAFNTVHFDTIIESDWKTHFTHSPTLGEEKFLFLLYLLPDKGHSSSLLSGPQLRYVVAAVAAACDGDKTGSFKRVRCENVIFFILNDKERT